MSRVKLFILFVLIILLAGNVYALGITPGLSETKFKPNEKIDGSFEVINNAQEEMGLVVLVTGDLNESIELSEVSFSMAVSDNSKKLNYKLKMPKELSPGSHEARIQVVQLPKKSKLSEAYVGAVVGVTTIVRVFVPYPDKYAEAALNIFGGGAEKVTFVIPVLNKGSIDIVRARAVIDVYSSLNEKIATLETNEKKVKVSEREELAVKWDKDVPPGPYRAVANVFYDEEIIRLEKEFNVGIRELVIDRIEVNNFELGQIAKFETQVENKWSEQISNAYVQMQVFDNNRQVMADYKSATYDIPALSKGLLVSFWDTAGVNIGDYDADVILHYGRAEKTSKVQFEISKNKLRVIGLGYVISSADSGEGMFSMTVILIVIIGVLVLINILWFLVLRKKLAGR